MLRSWTRSKDDGMTRPTPVAPEAELPERRASRTDFPRERLRDLLSIARVHEPVQVAIRREQHRELVRVAPRTQLFAILTVLLMGWKRGPRSRPSH